MKRRIRGSAMLAGALGVGLFTAGQESHGNPSGPATASGPAFVHPGVLVNQAQLDFVKSQIAAGREPWASAFQRARTDVYYLDSVHGDISLGDVNYAVHPPHAAPEGDTTPATDEGIVMCGSVSDPDVHCVDEQEDGVAAYTQALVWYLSPDGAPDKEAHRKKALEILDGWSILKGHLGFNAALQSGWMGTEFARAAEIMGHAPGAGWAPASFAAFKSMMRQAYVPYLLGALPTQAHPGDAAYGQNGNWQLSIADSLIQIGVLLDDHGIFDQGVALWRDRTPAYCYLSNDPGGKPNVPCGGYGQSNSGWSASPSLTGDPWGYWGQAGRDLFDGLSQETCRDLEHVQYGLTALINGAETARIQGVDLYREEEARITACTERAASYVNQALAHGQPPDPKDGTSAPPYATPLAGAISFTSDDNTLCPSKVTGKGTLTVLANGSRGTWIVQPTWEIAYNEFATRLGIAMPQTQQLVGMLRSPPKTTRAGKTYNWVGASHHMAWETLTHAEVGNVGLEPTTCGP